MTFIRAIDVFVLMTMLAVGYCQNRVQNQAFDPRDDLVLEGIIDDVTNDQGVRDLSQTLLSFGLTAFNDYMEDMGIFDTLDQEGHYTVFAPTNQAFAGMSRWRRRRLRNATVLTRTLRNHLVNGKYRTSELADETLLTSLLGTGKTIRINAYPKTGNPTVYTAQCSLISETVETLSDVVHIVSKPVLVPYGDMLTSLTACPIFIHWTRAMRSVPLQAPYTMFPLTDRVFEAAYPNREAFFQNQMAVRELVHRHVVQGTYCSAGFQEQPMVTLSGMTLHVAVDGSDIHINGVKLISRDGVVTNGVSHCPQSPLTQDFP